MLSHNLLQHNKTQLYNKTRYLGVDSKFVNICETKRIASQEFDKLQQERK